MVSIANPPFTIDEFERLPGHERYELVDGELVERKMSWESSHVAMRAGRILATFVDARRLGFVSGADNGMQLVPGDRTTLRYADVSFTERSRVPGGRPSELGHQQGPPDLAVEVVSPNDLASEVAGKVELYLSSGVRLVWVIYPDRRIVHVYRPGGPDSRLSGDDILDGEDVVPGFRVPITDLWAEPLG